MTELEKLEGRVNSLEVGSKILVEIQGTVDLIYSAIATEPGGKQGLLDGHRSLVEKVDSIEAKVTSAEVERLAVKKELAQMKLIGAAAYGGLVVLVWLIQHGSQVAAIIKP